MTSDKPQPNKSYEINTRIVYGLRSIGKGIAGGKMLWYFKFARATKENSYKPYTSCKRDQ